MALDVDRCIERLLRNERIDEGEVQQVCEKVKELLIEESNVKSVSAPVSVVGDVHGQFFDVLELFRIGGNPPDTNYLFLGDYVDRGHHSVETISLLACLKLRYPERVTLLRGNHESRQVTLAYGFYAECMRKYGNPAVWTYFTDMFDYLTIAAMINNEVFCVHGGLSPSIQTLDQVRVLDRFQELPHEGPLADLLWSDPSPDIAGFQLSSRGAGYQFGRDIIDRFIKVNDVKHILRAHQLCMDGYQTLFGKISTVWSAPNYCYRCGNVASVLEIDDTLAFHFNTFSASPDSKVEEETGGERGLPEYFL